MIVFVTGASAGFGAAIARSFGKGGHPVVAPARRMDRLEALTAPIGDGRPGYWFDIGFIVFFLPPKAYVQRSLVDRTGRQGW